MSVVFVDTLFSAFSVGFLLRALFLGAAASLALGIAEAFAALLFLVLLTMI